MADGQLVDSPVLQADQKGATSNVSPLAPLGTLHALLIDFQCLFRDHALPHCRTPDLSLCTKLQALLARGTAQLTSPQLQLMEDLKLQLKCTIWHANQLLLFACSDPALILTPLPEIWEACIEDLLQRGGSRILMRQALLFVELYAKVTLNVSDLMPVWPRI